ncbi:MAG: DUF4232 domain-containing protein [Acidimicrobiaceae bacterium]|nr:DUF4232 domain-containing protein [Acidimicrobiaceae bacterium]
MRLLRTTGVILSLAGASLLPPLGGATVGALVLPHSCTPAHMRLSLGRPQGAAGTFYYPIVFTNEGALCTIFGVPSIRAGLQPRAKHATVYVGPWARNLSIGYFPALHRLAHHQSVSVAFAVSDPYNYTASQCRPKAAAGVYVTLGSFARGYLPIPHLTVCSAFPDLVTRLIVPGTSGV